MTGVQTCALPIYLMVNPDVLEKASLNNLAYTYTQLNQAQKLERGEATANLNVHNVVDDARTMLEQARRALEVGQGSDISTHFDADSEGKQG